MPAGGYTRGEVVYLLSLTHSDAVSEDARQPDSLARTSPEGPGAPTAHEEWDPVFTVARWHDVQAARRRALERKMTAANADPRQLKLELIILELRSRGWTEEEIAQRAGLAQQSVSRKARATLAEIVAELGGETTFGERTSSPPVCWTCGGSAVRVERRRRIATRGGRTTIREQRGTHSCAEHHCELKRNERFVTLTGEPVASGHAPTRRST